MFQFVSNFGLSWAKHSLKVCNFYIINWFWFVDRIYLILMETEYLASDRLQCAWVKSGLVINISMLCKQFPGIYFLSSYTNLMTGVLDLHFTSRSCLLCCPFSGSIVWLPMEQSCYGNI